LFFLVAIAALKVTLSICLSVFQSDMTFGSLFKAVNMQQL
jgi:hypothetical protein